MSEILYIRQAPNLPNTGSAHELEEWPCIGTKNTDALKAAKATIPSLDVDGKKFTEKTFKENKVSFSKIIFA